jgi:hypothetical protein
MPSYWKEARLQRVLFDLEDAGVNHQHQFGFQLGYHLLTKADIPPLEARIPSP